MVGEDTGTYTCGKVSNQPGVPQARVEVKVNGKSGGGVVYLEGWLKDNEKGNVMRISRWMNTLKWLM